MIDGVTIRPAESPADYLAVQQAQRRAWGIVESSYVVPIATMVGAQLHGGLVLGAFRPDGEALGLSFAFLGRSEGRLCLYSQLTGVVPEAQGLGIGGRMKAAQRSFARDQGIPIVAWAFDPFRLRNARFNLDRLGVTVARYLVNMYGPRTDALNAGRPTDRLIAEWPASNPPPRRDFPVLDDWRSLPRPILGGRPVGGFSFDVPRMVLEMPAEEADAEGWREAVRFAFSSAFARGHRAVGIVGDGAPGSGYLLEKRPG